MTTTIAVIGAGPAGLMAAERLAEAGHQVSVYEAMPSPARKLLMAGRGGLNLTHSEPLDAFLTRYGTLDARIVRAIEAFPPQRLRAWAEQLGQPTFVGSSGRVFPEAMKASPLLRSWLKQLHAKGVAVKPRHRWTGWDANGSLTIEHPDGHLVVKPDAALLALGGASWPRLGSDGEWQSLFADAGIPTVPLSASNVGVCADWSETFGSRFEGAPLKRIAGTMDGTRRRGEAIVTRGGLEGGVIYALCAPIRHALASTGEARLTLDLRPDLTLEALVERLARPKGSQSWSTFLRKAAGLSPVAIGLAREAGPFDGTPLDVAQRIKASPIRVTGLMPIDRAISSAGGVTADALDDRFMLKQRPGTFVCGEMLDWDAPTGGYLLQATFATACAAAGGIDTWLKENLR